MQDPNQTEGFCLKCEKTQKKSGNPTDCTLSTPEQKNVIRRGSSLFDCGIRASSFSIIWSRSNDHIESVFVTSGRFPQAFTISDPFLIQTYYVQGTWSFVHDVKRSEESETPALIFARITSPCRHRISVKLHLHTGGAMLSIFATFYIFANDMTS